MNMSVNARSITILMAEDDPDDQLLARDAFRANRVLNELKFVEDGEEMMDYLCQRGRFANPADAPRPGLILLDLNMPRKDGREVLEELKQHPELRRIPVVVLTTSKTEEDIIRSYDLGVSSYITKPVAFEELVAMMKVFQRYWLEIVELPAPPDACPREAECD